METKPQFRVSVFREKMFMTSSVTIRVTLEGLDKKYAACKNLTPDVADIVFDTNYTCLFVRDERFYDNIVEDLKRAVLSEATRGLSTITSVGG